MRGGCAFKQFNPKQKRNKLNPHFKEKKTNRMQESEKNRTFKQRKEDGEERVGEMNTHPCQPEFM